MENSEDCKNVKVYFKIEYKDKDEIKKCKAKSITTMIICLLAKKVSTTFILN
jgi:hypothetical protein